ncbi:hypothetical protein PO124_32170 [Bacillus licheniformis]|nr:hypothetical protein [Bacillus licheniformis]
MHVLVNTLRFPVTVYDKANGFWERSATILKPMSLSSPQILYIKRTKDGHAKWVEELFTKRLTHLKQRL